MKKLLFLFLYVVLGTSAVMAETILDRFKAVDTFSEDFNCRFEVKNSPPLSKKAEAVFQEAKRAELSFNKKDDVTINKLYQRALSLRHWKAGYELAMRYSQGKGVGQNRHKKALTILDAMAKDNLSAGIYGLAVLSQEGRGVPRNSKLASQYMHRAAKLGSPLAQLSLGKEAYQRKDYRLAQNYYLCAALQGNKDAAYHLAEDAEIAKNYPKAAKYYQLAASLGHAKAFANLNIIFDENSEEDRGYADQLGLTECLFLKEQELIRKPWGIFPNLDIDCPIPDFSGIKLRERVPKVKIEHLKTIKSANSVEEPSPYAEKNKETNTGPQLFKGMPLQLRNFQKIRVDQ